MPGYGGIAGPLLPEAGVVLAMLVVEIALLLYLVPRRGPGSTYAQWTLGGSALLGSAAVLLALLWAFLFPNLNSFTILFETFGITMGFPPGLWMIATILFHDRRVEATSWIVPVSIAVLATAGELLMGLYFTLLSNPSGAPADLLGGTLTSIWYLGSMGAAMVALVGWIPMGRGERTALGGLALSAFVAPWVPSEPIAGAVLMALLMMGTLLGALAIQSRSPQGRETGLEVLPGVAGAFTLMTVGGLLLALAAPSPAAGIAFGSLTSAAMFAEFLYLLRTGFLRATDPPGERTARPDGEGSRAPLEPAGSPSAPG